jgi:hypothetical protein
MGTAVATRAGRASPALGLDRTVDISAIETMVARMREGEPSQRVAADGPELVPSPA